MPGLRLLTYNTQMRSWGLEALAQGSIDPTTSVETRSKTIAKRIKASPHDYDIICLQEIFDEDAREIFTQELAPGTYPARVLKADTDTPGGYLAVGAGAALLAIPGAGLLAGAGLILAGVLTSKFEDSGLMLFSRLPFMTETVPSALAEMFQGAGLPVPATVPIVSFLGFDDSSGADRFAAKGVLYAQLNDNGRPIHLLCSHTQADSTKGVGENHAVRRKQLEQVRQLLEAFAGSPPYNDEVIFCGDLNIDGLHRSGTFSGEWTARFGTTGEHFTTDLHDVWVNEQCPGTRGNPLPITTCDPGPTAGDQRLDYFLRPPNAFSGRRITQHICVATEIAQSTNPNDATIYTSDHLPLRLDLHDEIDHQSAITAKVIAPTVDEPDVIVDDSLRPRQMHWYRIDEQGGYGIHLDYPGVGFEVYTASDLSHPVKPYSKTKESADGEGVPLTRFALPSAPFFIRVFTTDDEGADYRLSVHRYLGTSQADAIPISRGVPERGVAKYGAPHGLGGSSGLDDFDAVWFTVTLDGSHELPGPFEAELTAIEDQAFALMVAIENSSGSLVQIAEGSEGSDPVTVPFEVDRTVRGYLLARRRDPSFQATGFDIVLRSSQSYLYGNPAGPGQRALGQATLFCIDETDGTFGNEWGSDDLELAITAPGTNIFFANTSDMQFDDDSRRDVPIGTVRYVDVVDVVLTELDDTSGDDHAQTSIPGFTALAPGTGIVKRDPCSVLAQFPIDFESDDGNYQLTITVSQEPPTGP